MGSGQPQGWHKGVNADTQEAAQTYAALRPWHATTSSACKTQCSGGWARCPLEVTSNLKISAILLFFRIWKTMSFHRNHRIVQSMSMKWVRFPVSSGSKQDTREHKHWDHQGICHVSIQNICALGYLNKEQGCKMEKKLPTLLNRTTYRATQTWLKGPSRAKPAHASLQQVVNTSKYIPLYIWNSKDWVAERMRF